MRLDPADEAFISAQIDGIRAAITEQSCGDTDRAWTLGRRLCGILAARAHVGLAEALGLNQAKRFDAQIEVRVDGVRLAVHEAGFLRTEVWVGLLESAHSVIDDQILREEVMNRVQIGDDALPLFEDREKRT